MFKKYFIIISFFIFAPAIFLPAVFAEEGSVQVEEKIEVKELYITTGQDKINISAVVFNPSDKIETSPTTNIIILENLEIQSPLTIKKGEIISSASIVVADEGKDFFTLKPLETKKLDYELALSPFFPESLYVLKLGFIKSDGSLLGKDSQKISIKKANHLSGNYYEKPFLNFLENGCFITNQEGKKYSVSSGPLFESSSRPKIGCEITNIGKEAASVKPIVLWKEFFVYGRPGDGKLERQIYSETFDFKAGETRTVELSLPEVGKPQVYQALLAFENADGQKMSFHAPFRWTIKGSSARIEKVSLASPIKKVYEKGETIVLSIDYFGSMDLYWQAESKNMSNLSEVKIEAIVKDSKGEECGRNAENAENVTDALLKNIKITVSLDKKCENPSYLAAIIAGSEKLSEQAGALPNLAEKNKIFGYKNIIWFFMLVFWVGVFMWVRKKTAIKKYLFFLAFLFPAFSVFSFPNAAFATQTTRNTEVTHVGFGGNLYGGGNVVDTIDKKTYTGTKYTSSNRGGKAFVDNDDYSRRLYSFYSEGGVLYSFNSARINHLAVILDDFFDFGADGWLNFELDGSHEFSCSNESAVFKIWLMARDGKTGEETSIRSRLWGKPTWQHEITKRFGDTAFTDWGKDIDINPDDLKSVFYPDPEKILSMEEPQIAFYLKQAGKNHEDYHNDGFAPYFRGFFDDDETEDGVQYTSADSSLGRDKNNAFDKGDMIKVIIPLNLPNPEIDFFVANPNPASCGSTKLSWSTTDVDSCEASASPSNSQWTGGVANNGFRTITGLTGTTVFNLDCVKDLGPAIGTANLTKSVSVENACDLQVSCYGSPSLADINQQVTWVSVITGGEKPYTSYSWSGTDGLSDTTAAALKKYSTSGSKTANFNVEDSAEHTASASCEVTVTEDNILTLKVNGNCGKVTVTEDDGTSQIQENEGETSWPYEDSAHLKLMASPDSGDSFTSWSGDCAGNSDCDLTMDANKNVTANFDCGPETVTLTMEMTGQGGGSIETNKDDNTGITAGNFCEKKGGSGDKTCYLRYNLGTQIKLDYTTESGSYFNGWSGCDNDSESDGYCNVELTEDKEINADFGYNNSSTPGGDGCGQANGTTRTTAPSGKELCDNGTASSVNGTGPWDWTCTGFISGSTYSCSANLYTGPTTDPVVNGACGLADGSTRTTAPSGGELCNNGTASSVNGTGPWDWTCYGSGGGTDSPICNAELGSSSGGSSSSSESSSSSSYSAEPPQCGTTKNTCINGEVENITETSTEYRWSCVLTSSSSSSSSSSVDCSLVKGGNISIDLPGGPITATIINKLPTDSTIAKIGITLENVPNNALIETADIKLTANSSENLVIYYSIDEGTCDIGECWSEDFGVKTLEWKKEKEIWIKVHNITNETSAGLHEVEIMAYNQQNYAMSNNPIKINLNVEKITTKWQEI